MRGSADYEAIRHKVITDTFDKFPNLPNRTTARLLCEQYPTMFPSIEGTRNLVRYLRGCKGEQNRNTLKDKTYVRKPI